MRRINCRAAKNMLVKQRKISNPPRALLQTNTEARPSRLGAKHAVKQNKRGEMPGVAPVRSRTMQSSTCVKIRQRRYSRRSELGSYWVWSSGVKSKALGNEQREPSASQSCGPFRFARQRAGIDQRGRRVF